MALCRSIGLVAVFSMLALPAASDVDMPLSGEWESWAELGAVGSTELHRGEIGFFLPRGNDSTLGFLDLRAKMLTDFGDDDGFEGNFALGGRHMLETPILGVDWNIGGWVGADIRHSVSNNAFWQFSTGLELLSDDWDVRLNGYVPLTKKKPADSEQVDFDFAGAIALMEGAVEVPLYGFDAEVGWRVPFEQWGPQASEPRTRDHALRLYLGGFHFEDDAASEDVSGPRVRAEWNLENVVPGAPRARLSLGLEFQWDEMRDEQWSGGLRLRLPIGPESKAKARLAAQSDPERRRRRRMTERIVRDVDIVVGGSPKERIELIANGKTLGRVVEVTPDTADPEGAIESAGENGLAILVARNFRILVGRAINLNPGQVLIGGGNDLEVRGRKSRVRTIYPAPGTLGSGTLTGGNEAGTSGLLVAADDVVIQSVTIETSGNGIALFRDTGVVIEDATITTSGGVSVVSNGGTMDPAFRDEFTIRNSSFVSGQGIAAHGNSRFTIDDTRISPGSLGLSLDGEYDVTVRNSDFFTYQADGHAIVLQGEGSLVLDDVFVRTRGLRANAIQLRSADADLTIRDSELITLRTDADVVLAAAGTLSIRDSTITATEGRAVLLEGETVGAVSLEATLRDNALVAGAGFDEIAVIADGTSTVHVNAFGNVLDDGLGTIDLDEQSGTIRVVQGAPGTDASGIDARNAIGAAQVDISGNTVDFNEPLP